MRDRHANRTGGGRAGSPASAGVAVAGVLGGGPEIAEWRAPGTTKLALSMSAAATPCGCPPPTGAGSVHSLQLIAVFPCVETRL